MRWLVLITVAFLPWTSAAQDSKAALEKAAIAMGASTLRSIEYAGTGFNFALGQSPNPDSPWPRFIAKRYDLRVNYETSSRRQEMLRTQGENPARGGGGQPMAGEQLQIQAVSGPYAWNVTGTEATPAPAAADERMLQIWITPHGLLKAALANNATVRSRPVGARTETVVSFLVHGKFRVIGTINAEGLVEKVETWIDNPVLGDMLIETTYTGYRAFDSVQFPTRIVQKQGGFPVLDISVSDVRPNAPVEIEVPQAVRQAAPPVVRVEAQALTDGVWYLTGGSHHSVAIAFKDHVTVVEGPLNEERSAAVIAEIRKLAPDKPIKYLVNTHQHFDHSGGIRAYAAEGATIVTHQMHRPFYELVFAAPWTLKPDKLAQSKKTAIFATLTDKRVLTDGTRTLELHHVVGNAHNDGMVMAYLPAEKILIEADVYSPAAPNAPLPSTPNPFSVNLYENIQRLKLDVDRIAPIHGRLVALADLRKAIGQTP